MYFSFCHTFRSVQRLNSKYFGIQIGSFVPIFSA